MSTTYTVVHLIFNKIQVDGKGFLNILLFDHNT